MQRSEVKTKLAEVRKAIAEIESNEDEVVAYATQNKHLPGIGYISEIESFAELAKAHNEITKKSTNDLTSSIKALGLTDSEQPEETIKILGFKPKTWLNDINKRLVELRTEIRLEKLKQAEKVLSNNLSSDDKFTMETEGIDALLV